MNIIVAIIASTALALSGWLGLHNVKENTPNLTVGANSTISNLTAKTSLAGTDTMVIVDNDGTATTKKITFANATSSFKTYNDTIYSPLAGGTGITTLGTVTTGTWNATAIPVGYGGSGTTTWASNYVILGNGASGVKTVDGQGTSGYLLTSNGVGTAPTWQNVGVTLNANNTWTGSNTFNATTTVTASNVNSNAFVANGVAYAFPTSRGASSSLLTIDGSGNLNWYLPQVWATTTGAILVSSANTERTTVSATYALLKSIRVEYSGQVSAVYAYKKNAAGSAINQQLYLNGIALGAQQTSTEDANYSTSTETVSVGAGDYLQVYAKTNNAGNAAYVRNFQISYATTSSRFNGSEVITD